MEFLSSVFTLPADLPLWMPRVAVGLMILIGGVSVFFACRVLRDEGGKKDPKDPPERL